MRSSNGADGATPGLLALLAAGAADPGAAIARADAGARAGLGRIVAFIDSESFAETADEQVRKALSSGHVLCGRVADEQELAIACAPEDLEAPYSSSQSLEAAAEGSGRSRDVARLALSLPRRNLILLPVQESDTTPYEACPSGIFEIGGRRLEARILRDCDATLDKVGQAAHDAGAAIPCPLAHSRWLASGHGAYETPVAYDGTERLICAVLDGECLGVVALRGRWLEYESNHGNVGEYLDGAFDPGETGSYYLEGQGWTVGAIPYEQDADAGFDVTLKRPATAADAALLGDDIDDVESETREYIRDARS